MVDGFFAILEALAPSLGRKRSYRLEAGTDLFGAWWSTWCTAASWRSRPAHTLYRAGQGRGLGTATAKPAPPRERPQGIAVSYRFRELIDPAGD